MADLIAQGRESQHRWRRRLPYGQTLKLGREAGMWSVPWDQHVSRLHAELCWGDGGLTVSRLSDAANPVYLHGREADSFSIEPGEHFVIGETTFTLTEDQAHVAENAPQPLEEQTFSSQFLQDVRYRNSQHRIQVLNRLPDLIRGATNDTELFVRLVNMLLSGISRSDALAVVALEPNAPGEKPADVLHWDQRRISAGSFEPSQYLISEAIRRGQSVLHVWGAGDEAVQHPVTANSLFDWAFCTPVPGEACRGWAIYVAGRFTTDYPSGATPTESPDLRDDLKFTELVASILGSLLEVRRLRDQESQLRPFFSPAVLHALADEPDVVRPRETDVTVLFCDLRGFSRQAERSSADLLELLERTSQALGVMTHHILEQGGVFGDFQGDAAMGFWGWPIAQPDDVCRACRAALAIRALFEEAAQKPGDPMAGFRVGIGIATGRAVAGKIGTQDQVKVTVFGPVVNLASRLEGMTKLLHAPILLDGATAEIVCRDVPRETARCRRLAVVRPYGMETALEVSELLPPESEFPELADGHIRAYEAALDALLEGEWSEAFELLHQVPAQDRVKDFLTGFILGHNRTPPENWDGVIPLSSKG